MLVEQHFVDMSRHPKPVDPEWAAAVAEYLEEVGATDLDAPDAPKRKIQRTDAQLRQLEGIKKAKAEAKAQAEHQKALARLNDGTAVLRQTNANNEVIKKARAIKKNKPVEVKAVAKKIAKAKLGRPKTKPVKVLTERQIASREKRLKNKLKRDEMIATLTSGGSIPAIDWRGDSFRAHQMQSYQLMMIDRSEGLNIVRANQIGKEDGVKFIIDDFERCNLPEPISCLVASPDRWKLFDALASGKLISVDDIKEIVLRGSKAMHQISRTYDIDIYALFKSNKTVGWVLMPESHKSESKSEAMNLGDMLQALDYLKIKKELQASMPDATDDEIEEATFIEYRHIQKEGQ